MKTFVNALSWFRIAAAFAIIPTLIFQMFWLTFVLFAVAGITDFLDGYLAKKFNVVDKIGMVLDHTGDKLLTATGLIMATILTLSVPPLAAWLPVTTGILVLIPAILIICRNLYVSALREFLGMHKIEMPTTPARFSASKTAAALQMVSLSIIFFWFVVISGGMGALTREWMIFTMHIGVLTLWVALGFTIWSAVAYTRDFWNKFKKIR